MVASSRGPTQRSYAATVNSARKAGDLDALEALRRSAIDMHTSADSESIAEAPLALFQTWKDAQDQAEEPKPDPGSAA